MYLYYGFCIINDINIYKKVTINSGRFGQNHLEIILDSFAQTVKN